MDQNVETTQRASKQLRFGQDEVQPGQQFANHERLRGELLDVLACIRFLEPSKQVQPITRHQVTLHLEAKHGKIVRMLSQSRPQGCVTDQVSKNG